MGTDPEPVPVQYRHHPAVSAQQVAVLEIAVRPPVRRGRYLAIRPGIGVPREKAATVVQGLGGSLVEVGHRIGREAAKETSGGLIGLGRIADLRDRCLLRDLAGTISAQALVQAGQESTEIAHLVERELCPLNVLAVHPGQDAVAMTTDFHHKVATGGEQRRRHRNALTSQVYEDREVPPNLRQRNVGDLLERVHPGSRHEPPVPVHQAMGKEPPITYLAQPERTGQGGQRCRQTVFSSRIRHPQHGTPTPNLAPEFVTQVSHRESEEQVGRDPPPPPTHLTPPVAEPEPPRLPHYPDRRTTRGRTTIGRP